MPRPGQRRVNNMAGNGFDRPALLALLALETLYLLLVLSIGDRAHLGVSLLFIGATSLLLIDGPAPLRQPTSAGIRLAGQAIMLACVAACLYFWLQNLESTEKHPLRLLPMLMLAGVLLWRGGWAAITGNIGALMGLFFLGGPHLLVWWLNLPALLAVWSAKASAYLLWYLGADVVLQGTHIGLAGRAVNVTPECAGSDTITYLLGIGLLTLLLFPPPRRASYIPVLLMALAVAFLTNVVRIALLVELNTAPNPARFNYWHSSEGAQLFGVIAIMVFAGAYYLLQRHWQAQA